MDRKKALSIMGLKEEATDNEIEKRYYLLLRKYKMLRDTKQEDALKPDIDEITEAYNLLAGNVFEQEERKPGPLFEKLGVDEDKVRNFFHYYKWHIIIGIAAILVVFSLVKAVTQPRPDFNVAFIGNIYYQEADFLKEKIETEIDSVRIASIDGAAFLSKEMEYQMEMKAMVLLAAADVDVFITDSDKFKRFAKQGAFLKLDQLTQKHGIVVGNDAKFMEKSEEDDKKYWYGIDVSSSSLLKDSKIIGEELIFSIKVNTENPDKAAEFLKLLLGQ